MAFLYDCKARLIVNEALDRGDLESVGMDEKIFFILRLIHSENISDHIFANNLCGTYLKKYPGYGKIKKNLIITLLL